MSKSFMTIESKVCPVTGKQWETGAILIDRRLMDRFEKDTVSGWGISPEVQEILDGDGGRIAFVEIDPGKSEALPNGNVTPEGAYRTGTIVYLDKGSAVGMFGNGILDHPFVFAEPALIQKLKEIQDESIK